MTTDTAIAFLVLAHDQPEHVGRMIRALQHPLHRFFVHIDKKSDAVQFRKKAAVEHAGVYFMTGRDRLEIRWGGFRMVEATLRLIGRAWEHPEHFGRFCLLSGADYPIKPLEAIRTAMAEDIEYMRVDRRLSNRPGGTHSHYIERFFFADRPVLKACRLSGKFSRKPYEDTVLYHGSQWWALSRRAVGYILAFLGQNPAYERFHRYVHCPDEIFFVSILKSAPFADRISHDFETGKPMEPTLFGAHYIDWYSRSNGGKSPKVLTEEDYEKLRRCEAMFARKFAAAPSAALLRKIDRDLGYHG